MKKLFYVMTLLVICSVDGIYAQGLTYTPFFRETAPVPDFQPSYPQPQYQRARPSTRESKATVECVKNCIAILPDGKEPIVVHVHVKRFSDSDRSIGFIEPNSGKFFMFGNASDGLEQLVPTRAVDPSMAADWPYFVVFNTTAGEIICFLPNLNISRVSVYDIETFNKTN